MLLAVSISYAQGLVSATLCCVCSGALICPPLAPSALCPAGFQVVPWLVVTAFWVSTRSGPRNRSTRGCVVLPFFMLDGNACNGLVALCSQAGGATRTLESS